MLCFGFTGHCTVQTQEYDGYHDGERHPVTFCLSSMSTGTSSSAATHVGLQKVVPLLANESANVNQWACDLFSFALLDQ